ncbi:MAG TPA: hypothetical protein VGR24_05785 [bacterium]|jgi:hypothetical protein|nr:hypothetical protein [bacterium]
MVRAVATFLVTFGVVSAVAAPAPSTIIIPGRALGDLTVEMPLAEIKQRLGVPADCGSLLNPRDVGVCEWKALGIWISYDIPSEETRVLTKDVTNAPAWRTDQGLSGASNTDDVARVHGPPQVIISIPPARVTTYRYVDVGIQFTMVADPASDRNGRINEIGIFRPGRFPNR